MQEIGGLAMAYGWDNYIAYSRRRDGVMPCRSNLISVWNRVDVAWQGIFKAYYREHCRDYALQHFGKDARYADYLRLYEELL